MHINADSSERLAPGEMVRGDFRGDKPSTLPRVEGGDGTNVLVLYFSETNRTKALAQLVARGAAATPGVVVKMRSVANTTWAAGDECCDDLRWMHGLALGSPVYWGAASGIA
jgi:hypothetical protein